MSEYEVVGKDKKWWGQITVTYIRNFICHVKCSSNLADRINFRSKLKPLKVCATHTKRWLRKHPLWSWSFLKGALLTPRIFHWTHKDWSSSAKTVNKFVCFMTIVRMIFRSNSEEEKILDSNIKNII